jgi:hypothetical protein
LIFVPENDTLHDMSLAHEGDIRYVSPTEYGFIGGNGFFVQVRTAGKLANIYSIAPDALIGEIDFIPTGNVPRRIVAGLHGLRGFFIRISNEVLAPEYLVGGTTPNMANAVKRLGFDTIDLSDKVKSSHERKFFVIGRTEVVKNKLDEILSKRNRRGQTIMETLNERAKPEPIPMRY